MAHHPPSGQPTPIFLTNPSQTSAKTRAVLRGQLGRRCAGTWSEAASLGEARYRGRQAARPPSCRSPKGRPTNRTAPYGSIAEASDRGAIRCSKRTTTNRTGRHPSPALPNQEAADDEPAIQVLPGSRWGRSMPCSVLRAQRLPLA